MKLVHLVGFIIKKFVTMHGHTNVKFGKHCLICNGFRDYRMVKHRVLEIYSGRNEKIRSSKLHHHT
jgi:hypothetical protein